MDRLSSGVEPGERTGDDDVCRSERRGDDRDLLGAGTYVLRLAANDGHFTVSDDVSVAANGGNTACGSTASAST